MFRALKPEEFIVEEILQDGTVLEMDGSFDFGKPEDQTLERDYFTHFVMQKTDWNTLEALGALARKMHIKPGRFNAAGNKDKKAITVQRCSAFAIAPERLKPMQLKDVKILGIWKAREKVKLGDLAGNRFTIALTEQNCGRLPEGEKLVERANELNHQITNIFGPQRFGSQRQNTARIGEWMLKGEYEKAVWECVAGGGDESRHIAEAREKLRNERDFAASLAYFPEHLRSERRLLEHLASQPTDFIGALRCLPRTLALLYVHAYQSELFNEYAVKEEGDFVCDSNSLGFPDLSTTRLKKQDDEKEMRRGKAFPVAHIIGYETELTESEAAFLKEKAVSPEIFKLKSMPELSSKGTFRPTKVPLKGFEIFEDKPVKVRFALPSGAYATVALDQLLE